jgi:hypothetical protein
MTVAGWGDAQPHQQHHVWLAGQDARHPLQDPVDARAWLLIGPPGVPHGFANLGPGRAKLVCIHAAPAMSTEFV